LNGRDSGCSNTERVPVASTNLLAEIERHTLQA
jgi:hypothetical protein